MGLAKDDFDLPVFLGRIIRQDIYKAVRECFGEYGVGDTQLNYYVAKLLGHIGIDKYAGIAREMVRQWATGDPCEARKLLAEPDDEDEDDEEAGSEK